MRDEKLEQTRVKAAQQKVVRFLDQDPERLWHEIHFDSYDDSSWRMNLYVLEGSPARATIIVDSNAKTLVAFAGELRFLFKNHW